MGYFKNKGHFFSDDFDESLEHRAKYGTANSTASERGADVKKNNTSEYNHKYYEEHKDKWKNKKNKKNSNKKQTMSDDDDQFYDKDGKARFGHKDYDANDADFKRTDGKKIDGTDLTVFKNANGSTIILGKGIKFSFPPGTKITSAMEKKLASIENGVKDKDKNKESYVAKMLNAVTGFADRQGLNTDTAGKKSSGDKKSSSKKKSSGESSSSNSTSSSSSSKKKETTKWEQTVSKYNGSSSSSKSSDYTGTAKKVDKATAQKNIDAAQKRGESMNKHYSKQAKKTKKKQTAQFKHFDENGAIIRYFKRED